jgi:hypothetical protein
MILRPRPPGRAMTPKPPRATPSGRQPTSRRMRASNTVDTASHDGVAVFRDDDESYLAWVAAHPTGFVVNTQRSGNPSDTPPRATP